MVYVLNTNVFFHHHLYFIKLNFGISFTNLRTNAVASVFRCECHRGTLFHRPRYIPVSIYWIPLVVGKEESAFSTTTIRFIVSSSVTQNHVIRIHGIDCVWHLIVVNRIENPKSIFFINQSYIIEIDIPYYM